MADSFVSRLITELAAKTTAEDNDLVPIADSNGNFFKMTWQKMKHLLLGTKDISGVGDGTVTGSINELNTNIDTWKSEKKSQWVVFAVNETITLPGVDTYLILTAHNSTATLNGMWIYRPGNSTLWAIREASSISIDKNGYNIKVTSSAGTPSCMYCRLSS